jgi:riboflavin synthase
LFTGIVEDVGTVAEVGARDDVRQARIQAGPILHGLTIGGSVAVNGCCLTAVATAADAFVCELTAETLARTSFEAQLRPGALVNLERPLKADGRFDGHIVQGHVDGVGRIVSLERTGLAAQLVVAPPPALLRYVVEKGSITVDGISLTVAALLPDAFAVAVIPYTLERTNLRAARPGDGVNLEVDVIAKYVERLLTSRHG